MIEIEKLVAKDRNMNGLFIRLPRQDAIELIASLAEQIKTNNPNRDRKEWVNIKGKFTYFSIAVIPEIDRWDRPYIRLIRTKGGN